MIVNIYSDHIAYTFEDNEHINIHSVKYLRKKHECLILMAEARYNGSYRIMYDLDNILPLNEIAGRMPKGELVNVFISFINSVFEIAVNDSLNIRSIDMNYSRLFFDSTSNQIKYVYLPINEECDCHDNNPWIKNFKNTVLILLGYIFKESRKNYNDAYYTIMNDELSEYDVLKYVLSYDYKSVLSL